MLDGMSDSIQRSRIENLHSTEVDRQSPTGLIFFFKNRETSRTDRQPGSGKPRTSHTAENIDAVNDLVLSKKSAQGHTKLPGRSPGNWHFADVSGTHHKDIQLKCLKKRRVQELTASNI